MIRRCAILGLAIGASCATVSLPPRQDQRHRVVAIAFAGNEKTRDQTMLRELGFGIGDRVTPSDLAAGRQAIMDLGLFESVALTQQDRPGGIAIRIEVVERIYWYVLPRLSRNSDGDVSVGAAWKTDNVWGLDHQSKLTLEYTDYADANLEAEQGGRWRYDYPRIGGSLFNLQLDLGKSRSDIHDGRDGLAGSYDRDLDQAEIGVSRWLNEKGRSRGWEAGVGLRFESYDHELRRGDPGLFFDADIPSVRAGLRYFRVNNFLYSRSGVELGGVVRHADEALGSDVSFTWTELYIRGYKPITRREHTNLNGQLRWGHASRSLFGSPQHDIGGGTRLRGYPADVLQGDDYLIGNLEFLRPIAGLDELRGVVFADLGSAWGYGRGFDFGDIEYAAGLGLRWKLILFVEIDLRVDVAHGFGDRGETRVYFGTNATF